MKKRAFSQIQKEIGKADIGNRKEQPQKVAKLSKPVLDELAECKTAENYNASCTSRSTSPRIVTAPDLVTLEEILSNYEETTSIFFDIHETLLFPRDAPFIYGLPNTDAFVKRYIKGEQAPSCFSKQWKELRELMVKEYYNTPLELVEPGFPALLRKLKAKGHDLYAITCASAHHYHTPTLLSHLNSLFLSLFNDVPPLKKVEVLENVICTDYGDKGVVIREIVSSDGWAVLIDNTLHKCEDVLNAGYDAVHYKGAYNHGNREIMLASLSGYMRILGHDSFQFCNENEEGVVDQDILKSESNSDGAKKIV